MRKPAFCIYVKTKIQISVVTAQLISAFVFATKIILSQSLYFLNPKFQACSDLLCLYSLIFVGTGRKTGFLMMGLKYEQCGFIQEK